MQKNKRPVPCKMGELNKLNQPSARTNDKDEIQVQTLCDLAIVLVDQDDSEDAAEIDARRRSHADLHKVIRKSLQQKKDEILYDAIRHSAFRSCSRRPQARAVLSG